MRCRVWWPVWREGCNIYLIAVLLFFNVARSRDTVNEKVILTNNVTCTISVERQVMRRLLSVSIWTWSTTCIKVKMLRNVISSPRWVTLHRKLRKNAANSIGIIITRVGRGVMVKSLPGETLSTKAMVKDLHTHCWLARQQQGYHCKYVLQQWRPSGIRLEVQS
jgi:hypothetical protein